MDNNVEFRVINNAFTSIRYNNNNFLFDPWAIGNLYLDTWAPFPTPINVNNFIKDSKFCYISHIHQDHCDPKTLELLDKESLIVIPDIYPNHILKKQISNLGFNKITMLKPMVKLELFKNFFITVIPPLNDFGLEQDVSEEDENKIAIDTGVLIEIESKELKGKYVLLGDNSPYNIDLFKKHFPYELDLVMFPFNGFADDYPLCYDNLSLEDKSSLSNLRSQKRFEYLLNFFKNLKPKLTSPHSSDFMLIGPRQEEFLNIHNENFMHKDLFAKKLNENGVNCVSLYEKDTLIFSDNGYEFNQNSSENDRRYFINPEKNFSFDKFYKKYNFSNIDLDELLKLSLLNSINKAHTEKFNEWTLNINVKNTEKDYFLNFDKNTIEKRSDSKKILKLTIDRELLILHLNCKLHWDNSQIACYLSWERNPNEYNPYLYDALNYLHVKRDEILSLD